MFEIVEVEDGCDAKGEPVHIDFEIDFGDTTVGGKATGSGVAFLLDSGC